MIQKRVRWNSFNRRSNKLSDENTTPNNINIYDHSAKYPSPSSKLELKYMGEVNKKSNGCWYNLICCGGRDIIYVENPSSRNYNDFEGIMEKPDIPYEFSVEKQVDACFKLKDVDIEELYRIKMNIDDPQIRNFVLGLQDCLSTLHREKKLFTNSCLRIEQRYSMELDRTFYQLQTIVRSYAAKINKVKNELEEYTSVQVPTGKSNGLLICNGDISLPEEKDAYFDSYDDHVRTATISSQYSGQRLIPRKLTSFELIRTELESLRATVTGDRVHASLNAIEKAFADINNENYVLNDFLQKKNSIMGTGSHGAVSSMGTTNFSLFDHNMVDITTSREKEYETLLALKQEELSSTLRTFATMQVDVMSREEKLRAERREAEGRLEIVERERSTIRDELSRLRVEFASLQADRDRLRASLGAMHESSAVKSDTELLELRQELKEKDALLQQERTGRQAAVVAATEADRKEWEARNAMTSITEKLRIVQERLAIQESQQRSHSDQQSLTKALENERVRASMLEKEIEKYREDNRVRSLKRQENEDRLRSADSYEDQLKELRANLSRQVALLAAERSNWEDSMASLYEQVRTGEKKRRDMHNLIQELRGNIRICARVRPFLCNEGGVAEHSCLSASRDKTALVITSPETGGLHNFTFDRIFPPEDDQTEVFNEVKDFVQSALDGYAVCLFSYGQTGSGKTYTMQGAPDGLHRGIIPRAMAHLGEYMRDQENLGWSFEFEVSYLEIYMEQIRDLLAESGDDKAHEIRRNTTLGSMEVTNLVTVTLDPNDSDEVNRVIAKAAANRSVGRTDMNERSSRSHSVFSVKIRARNESHGAVLSGSLDLVDLAGSERLDKSNATGARMKETMSINTSLSHLTVVFNSIAAKQAHIPFRNSKLTYLLQPALSGDGKTLMMINLSPVRSSFQESLNTLRFALGVSQLELGRAKKHIGNIKTPRDKDRDAGNTHNHSSKRLIGSPSAALTSKGGQRGVSGTGSDGEAAISRHDSLDSLAQVAEAGEGLDTSLVAETDMHDDMASVLSDMSENSDSQSILSRTSRGNLSVVSSVSNPNRVRGREGRYIPTTGSVASTSSRQSSIRTSPSKVSSSRPPTGTAAKNISARAGKNVSTTTASFKSNAKMSGGGIVPRTPVLSSKR